VLLISNKRGGVFAMTDPDNSMETQQVLDIEYKLCTNGERGLQAVEPHPNFAENYYIYLYYTLFREGCEEDPQFGPRNRLSRFVMDPDTLQIMDETEEILLEGAPTHKFYHNGGAVKFGNDGKLYVTTGDGGGDSLGTSQDLTNLHGVVMRLNDDGTVPDDNPFTFQGGYNGVPCGQTNGQLPSDAPQNAVCSEIFAYGLRNPFRIVMDPTVTNKTRFLINDVGGAVWEDISEGGTDFAGMNYGWPMYEGPCRFGSTTECPLYDANADSSIEEYERFVKPLYYYEHRSEREGGCVSGGAFVPPGVWPAEYKYVYGDFIFQEIYNLVEAPEAECTTCMPPVPAYVNDTLYTSIKEEDQHENFARIVDMFFGPYKDTQALYVFKMGGSDNIWRIRYTGSVNVPPVANIVVEDTRVDVGQIVAFNGSQSYDVDDATLAYQWDFGDGDFSQEANPIHVYESPGQYTVRLSVRDSAGQIQADSVVLMVGTPPTLNITSPPEGAEFFVGEIIVVSGVGFNSTGGALDDMHISWEVRKHHADHWHPFLDQTNGNNLQLSSAPEPEDYLAATNSYLEIIMYATDDTGLTSTAVRNVYPRLVQVCVDSEPQGLEVYVDEYPIVTPKRITSWVNHNLRLRVPSVEGYNFSAWSDSVVAQDRKIRLQPNNNPGLLAAFCTAGNSTCISEAEARASESLLVARCPSEAPSAAPSMVLSSSPSYAPSEEPEEEWPLDEDEVDVFISSDGEPIPDRPHDEELPPVDNENIWGRFDEDGATTAGFPLTVVACILALATFYPLFL